MDYEKILKRIVQIINTTENSDIGFTNICTCIGENCPELQESEDERIRKELIDYINRLTVTPNNIDRYNSWIAWLEKQVQSTTITIPKDLKGTDTDGCVVGEKGEQGEQPTNKNFKERYKNIAESEWFKKTHKNVSIGEEQPTEEDSLETKAIKEQIENLKKRIEDNQLGCIVQRLDKIIELLQAAILILP